MGMLFFGALASRAHAAPVTVELTITPEFVNINGTNYPNGIYDGFNGHLPPVAPQFSKIVATFTVDFNDEVQIIYRGTTVQLYDVHDPSNVIFTTSGPADHYLVFLYRPTGTPGNDTPYAKLAMDFRGPDTTYGEGYFTTTVYFPEPFAGNGTAVMPNSGMLSYIDYWSAGGNRADYFIASVTSVVIPEPAGAISACAGFASLLLRRRGKTQ
jgi:hypothetical protein